MDFRPDGLVDIFFWLSFAHVQILSLLWHLHTRRFIIGMRTPSVHFICLDFAVVGGIEDRASMDIPAFRLTLRNKKKLGMRKYRP
jgi:hypothetical protein